ncbi:MAG: redox-regulated ATPase YchF [Syntrophaceae bacterium]|nr:redox-regulated ATPase YchF [Syntrophaceae bacterium]
MEIGILGLPQSGKSTLFEIMTGVKSCEMHGEAFVRGISSVPDVRFDRLVQIYKPAKVSPAKVPFIDVNASGEKAWNAIRQNMGNADGFIHIIDGFSTSDLADVAKQYRKLTDDLILADMVMAENRMERIQKVPKKSMKPLELLQLDLMPRIHAHLEQGRVIRELHFNEEEMKSLRSFAFWTIRPELIVINTGEDSQFEAGELSKKFPPDAVIVSISCEVEREIMSLSDQEQQEFLASLNISEPAYQKIIRESFKLLDCISYFTVGEDEVKAWVIPKETKAPQAAGVIHKDFERGFIKAEVVSYDDFMKCGESMGQAKAAGKIRLEGKEYVVQDGDIITFRFNV